MDFDFSKDEELWRWAVKDFANRGLATKEFKAFDSSFREILKKMGELGFLSIKLPSKDGSDYESWVMLGILLEEISKINVNVAYFILITHEITSSLAYYGSDEVKEEYLPSLIKGEKIGCIALTEVNAGTDLMAMETIGNRKGTFYLLKGEKTPVSFAMEADVILTFVRNADGIMAILVPAILEGIKRSPVNHMGLNLSGPGSIMFKEVMVPSKYILGKENEGLIINETTCLFSNVNQIMSGIISLGMAQKALELAIRYAKERFAFGKPIGKFEGISNKIAEDMTLIEAGRWLCYRALSLQDRGSPNKKEAAMCGWWCPKISFQIIQNALLIHGHSGYCDELPLQQMLRDAVAFEIISGTEQVLKLKIAHEALGTVFIPDEVLDRVCNL